MAHSHPHVDAGSGDRRVSVAIWANALLTVAQVVGGVLSGSLALIADALHNFSDMASLVIAYAARRIARRPADSRMTFGYARIEVVAALINYTTLIIVGVYLVYEGALRLIDPPEVAGWTVVVVGTVALLVDTLTALLTWSMQKGSMNIRALFLHNLSDALASVGVVAGGTLILLYDWWVVDPIVTLAIAGYILYLSINEIGGPIRTLMLGSPPAIDADILIRELCTIDEVSGIHHVHLWQMQEHEAALDCHVVLTDIGWGRQEAIKSDIKETLKNRFDISHSSLEFEHVDRAHQDVGRFCDSGGTGHDASGHSN
jgi:cobalt-zinc-cadmium efflux system protein